MERILSILAIVIAIGIGAYGYVVTDRQRGEIATLNQKVETLTKTVGENQKALVSLSQELAPILQMIREQAGAHGAPPPNVDMSKLTDEANTAYLEKYATEDGVTKRPSGLMYRVITNGPEGGKQPTPESVVTINYSGAFIDGTEFDSSYPSGAPVTFPLAQLIPGWVEALPLMKEGDAWEVVVPFTLGYGEKGRGSIPGRQTLVFKIELVKVES
ncbi:hypothetical protein sos41_33170 [Alphaproteobacteria bacterium SO-S41]|nr:hypothetical protein sos41_33170 [Alphaproteobacteria bacterium SO-S41]